MNSLAFRYARSCLTVRTLALVGGTAALAAFFGGTPAWLHALLVAATALALQLLDDVIDWRHDRKHHPQRVLCALGQRQRNQLLVATVLLLAAFSAWHVQFFSNGQVAGAYTLMLVLIYGPGASRTLRKSALLAKYPALVFAGALDPYAALIPALSLYLVLLLATWFEQRGERVAARAALPRLDDPDDALCLD